MEIKTLCGDIIETDNVVKYTATACKPRYPHWGWLVASLLLFYPAAIVWLCMGWMRNKMCVECHYGRYSDVHWLSEDEYKKFKKAIVENELAIMDKRSK